MNLIGRLKQLRRCRPALASIGLLLLGSGCASMQAVKTKIIPPKPGILATRTIIPPPSRDPSVQATDLSMLPPQPMQALTPLTPLPILPSVEKLEPQISLPPSIESQSLSYKVVKNDSLWKIARRYGVSYQELASYNNLDSKAILKVGQTLRIPPGGQADSTTEREAPAAIKAAPKSSGKSSGKTSSKIARKPIPAGGKYTVQRGDSLWIISARYNVKIDHLRAWNNLRSDVLQIGQTLVLTQTGKATSKPVSPAPVKYEAPQTQLQPTPIVDSLPEPSALNPEVKAEPALNFPKTLQHTVVLGDTLQGLADMYDTSIEAIKKANPEVGSDADIKVNTKLTIPYN
jgi:LysM repeat protein